MTTPDGGKLSAEEAIGRLREKGVATVILAGSDTHGIARGKRIPIEQLERIVADGLALCEVIWVMHVDESDLVGRPTGAEGYFPTEADGYPDMFAVPDLGTARVVPWHDATALILCDWRKHDGAPVPLSPRGALRRVVDRVEGMGFFARCALELEFYALRQVGKVGGGDDLSPLQEVPTTYGLALTAEALEFSDEVVRLAQEFGLPIEACNPETGPGQFEITLRYADAMRAADDAFLFKQAVKEIAAQRDLTATFMAKAKTHWPGNSCHVHMSLWEGAAGQNAFFDQAADHQGSETLAHFVGGVLQTMPEFTALMAPTINSYRRFSPYSWAGTTATWGVDNRSTGLRMICEGSSGTRIEHRQAGGDVNPYIAVAALLAGGLHGVERKVSAPAMTFADVYALSGDEVVSLPRSLEEAVELLAASETARDWLGTEFVDHFVALKRDEVGASQLAVTDWEVARYLRAL